MNQRSYSELQTIPEFSERFRYLVLRAQVGLPTFGYDRWLNQRFYASSQWRQVRSYVIARDNGCDLGVEGYEIHDRVYIHHMNPMGVDDVLEGNPDNLDPEFLITTTHQTHNAIHYGDERHLPRSFVVRRPGDTRLW